MTSEIRKSIEALYDLGYSIQEIAEDIGYSEKFVSEILFILWKKEMLGKPNLVNMK